jgi:hypothetical protein
MLDAAYEIAKTTQVGREKIDNHLEANETEQDIIAHASTEDVMEIRNAASNIIRSKEKFEVSSKVQQAEQLYKDFSLELYFRINGEKYRDEYNQWLEIKRKKQYEWEHLLFVKYGENWKQLMTLEDSKLLPYSDEELAKCARYNAIEDEAMQLKDKDIEKLQSEEGEDKNTDREGKINFFKLVKIKTLEECPYLGEKEVHNAIYSMEFLLFYIKQVVRTRIKRGINHIVGKQVPDYMEFQSKLYEAIEYIKTLVVYYRLRPQDKLADGITNHSRE